MKKNTIAAFAAALSLSAALSIAPAFAGEIEGTVSALDAAAMTVTLESGEVFTAGEGVELGEVAVGNSVVIVFDDASNQITDIEVK